LWSQARYKAPVINIVLNNKSYNNERNRIWHFAGRQFQTGRDMTCYNGSPDIDYAKAAEAFGVGVGQVTLPNGPGKELTETRCTGCHDLDRVAGVKRRKQDWPEIVANMIDRGAAATADEAQAI